MWAAAKVNPVVGAVWGEDTAMAKSKFQVRIRRREGVNEYPWFRHVSSSCILKKRFILVEIHSIHSVGFGSSSFESGVLVDYLRFSLFSFRDFIFVPSFSLLAWR